MTAAVEARFAVPDECSAGEPPEARGLVRDEVRLLVARPDGVAHARFRDLASFLEPGDLVVVNTSATLPAAVDGTRADGSPVVVHVSGPVPGGARDEHVVELRRPDGGRVRDGRAGERIRLPRGVVATLTSGHPDGTRYAGSRLWHARLAGCRDLPAYLRAAGRPITYRHTRGHWPLPAYQTVFAREPGSAEMPSAGRPFSRAVLDGLAVRGVGLATVTLHAGVSSPEAGEPPLPERFRVPRATARAVRATRARGGRVVATGTTVTRALETVAATDGTVATGHGWTDLVLGPDRPARVVDGLVTGWHEPDASHLLLLDAVAGGKLVDRAYAEALAGRYLWHEFGDSCLLLPGFVELRP